MDLSIIIVNFNVYHDLKNCLSSVIEKIKGLSYEIIVLDNNSGDRSIENLNTEFPGVKLIELKENIGFGRANNKGAESANGKYLLLLNPDTLIMEDFVTSIIKFIDSDNGIGACGPMLLNEDGSYQDSSGFRIGLLYEIFESFMLIILYRRMKRSRYMRMKDPKIPQRVGWVSAACMILSRDCGRPGI
jgi:O-antigen biosynthesis protein